MWKSMKVPTMMKVLLALSCLPLSLSCQQSLLGDLSPGLADTLAIRYATVGRYTIAFAANSTPAGASYWRTDGLPTSLASIAGPALATDRLMPLGNRVLVVSSPSVGQATELATIDVASATATVIASFPPNSYHYGGTLGNLAILGIDDGVNGLEPWVTDGTAAGTRLLQDLVPGPMGSMQIHGYERIGDQMYMLADNGITAPTIWRTDGVTATAVGMASTGTYYSMTVSGQRLYWVASELGMARLFVFDPANGQTTELAESTTSWGVTNESLVPFRGGVLFDFDVDGSNNREPFFSDGTIAGTGPIVELHPAGASFPKFTGVLTSQGALFRGRDGTNVGIYVTDGTAAGTRLLKAHDATYSYLNPVRSLATGRALVAAYSSSLQAWDLFETDGTQTGTTLLESGVGVGSDAHVHNGRLYFMRDDPAVGLEPWVVSVAPTAIPVGSGCGSGTRLPTLRATAPRFGASMTFFGDQAPVGVAGALFFSAVPTQATSLGGRCLLELDAGSLTSLSTFVSPTDSWQYSLTIPNVPALQGLPIATQAWFLQPSHVSGYESSNAVHLALGI